MFGSTMLDVAVGLAVVFSLLALLVTTLNEAIESMIKARGRNLERAIRGMVGDDVAAEVYSHPLVSGLYRGRYIGPPNKADELKSKAARHARRIIWSKRPAYIPSHTFAVALIDVAKRGDHSSQANRAVRSAMKAAQLDPNRSIAEVESWFNAVMDRASGWYKRRTQWILFFLSFAVAIVFNVDAMEIARQLYRDPAVRSALVVRAGNVPGAAPDPTRESMATIRKQLDSLKLPLAAPEDLTWAGMKKNLTNGWIGLLFTAFAASLGAPFWFDLLNKLMVIRSTVKPREKSQDEGSEDRSKPQNPGSGTNTPAAGPPAGPVPAGFPAEKVPVGKGPEGEF